MTTGLLLLTTALKILFILLVTVGAFAPMLVWAERRQSAMMQDRIGPHRAGIRLPAGAADAFRASVLPMRLAAAASGAVGALLLLLLAFAWAADDASWLPVSPLELTATGVGLLVLGGILDVGSKIHGMLADNGGNISLAGLLHPLADALKFIFKEDFVPPKADKLLHSLAPIITLMPAIAVFAVIPFSDVLYLEHWDAVVPRNGVVTGDVTAIPLQVANLNVGVLFLFAIAGTGIIGAAIGGYASDNKYSLIGGIRAASQMVSYEVALGLTIVPCFMIYDSLRLEAMATWQHDNGVWGICVLPITIAFVLFFTAAIGETKRIPFDLPEGESELVGGYLTEYSGMKFGMFFMSEFIEVVGLAAVATVIFFGGWDLPFVYRDGIDFPGVWDAQLASFVMGVEYNGAVEGIDATGIALAHWGVLALGVVGFLAKIVALIWFQLLTRWSLPRFRYDQMMQLCWKGLLPAALGNILFTGVVVLLGEGAMQMAVWSGTFVVVGSIVFFFLPALKRDPRVPAGAQPAAS
ncbi:MAG: NADH-quinone oxidoreductase subunit H [Myxococcales bacterium]|nr:NADH-quinone oxidoreductase subunit H [Myxococcales bacterium]MCB9627507.1 NADH-quinone oxidoreductase subunit H [Sandaracinaceae bacterium]